MIRKHLIHFLSSARQARRVAPLVLGGLLFGCAGGSGSSGFDISPLAENAFIVTALEESRCVDAEGLAICPTDTAGLVLPETSNAPGLPAPDVQLETDLGDTATNCFVDAAVSDSCRLEVMLEASGFPVGTRANLALRRVDPNGSWTVGESVGVDSGGAVASLDAARDGGEVQLAVLVFFAAEPLAPGEIATLTEARPDVVFVSEPFPLVVP